MAFLTAHSVASEAYRVTIPAVVQVALIRSAIEARREQQADRMRRKLQANPKQLVIALGVLCAAVIGAILLLGR